MDQDFPVSGLGVCYVADADFLLPALLSATSLRRFHPVGTLRIFVVVFLDAAIDVPKVEEGSHIVVAHEVTNIGHDRTQLANMGWQATGAESLTVLADRGYFSGAEVLACEEAGVIPICPKPLTSNAKAEGRFSKPDFLYYESSDTYRCPASEQLIKSSTTIENGLVLNRRWASTCRSCALKPGCTTGNERRVTRWEHEHAVEAMQDRLDRMPDAMRVRRRTIEHVFGTIKDWMGRSHFKTRRLGKVSTEMSLHVLAYNSKRAIALLGPAKLIAATQG